MSMVSAQKQSYNISDDGSCIMSLIWHNQPQTQWRKKLDIVMLNVLID